MLPVQIIGGGTSSISFGNVQVTLTDKQNGLRFTNKPETVKIRV
jgi:hypothetical protein